jgi:hypothetical protein
MNLLVFVSSHVILFQTKVKLVFVASLLRGPSIDASYEVSVWLRGFRGEDKNVKS